MSIIKAGFIAEAYGFAGEMAARCGVAGDPFRIIGHDTLLSSQPPRYRFSGRDGKLAAFPTISSHVLTGHQAADQKLLIIKFSTAPIL